MRNFESRTAVIGMNFLENLAPQEETRPNLWTDPPVFREELRQDLPLDDDRREMRRLTDSHREELLSAVTIDSVRGLETHNRQKPSKKSVFLNRV